MDIQKLLLEWYFNYKRNLPWRLTRDPYKIWVSEIIMQQTRVDQGLAYYQRFLERFPDVSHLALASEEEVLTVWKGLGYYSRARNMHHTASLVLEKFNGVFPSTYDELLTLKGIGKYTAAAVSSICSNEPHPVVDGNVIRVFSRIFGVHEPSGRSASVKKIYDIAESLIPKSNPGDFNQAVMEFGAIHCKPANPLCEDCLFQQICYAFTNEMTDKLPAKKKEVIKRNRFFNYFCVLTSDDKVLMQQRKGEDIWKNLWDLPMLESDHLLMTSELDLAEIEKTLPLSLMVLLPETFDFKHILTHQHIFARYFIFKSEAEVTDIDTNIFRLVSHPLNSEIPLSRLTERFLEKASSMGLIL